MVGVRWGRAHTLFPTGIQGVVEAYQNCLPRVQLYCPTNVRPSSPRWPAQPRPRSAPGEASVGAQYQGGVCEEGLASGEEGRGQVGGAGGRGRWAGPGRPREGRGAGNRKCRVSGP